MVSAESEPIMGVWVCAVTQSLSEEATDLTAAKVVSVASPTASFSPFSWYRTHDLHWLPVRQRVVFNLL